MRAANLQRGERGLTVGGETVVIRPSFEALVAAEDELGSLFALVDRAADGRLSLSEMAALFDHCSAGRPAGITRARIGETLVDMGLAGATPLLRGLLEQILKGR